MSVLSKTTKSTQNVSTPQGVVLKRKSYAAKESLALFDGGSSKKRSLALPTAGEAADDSTIISAAAGVQLCREP